MNALPRIGHPPGLQMRAACVVIAILISSNGLAQLLPGQIDQIGPKADGPAASRPTDVPVTGRGGALSPTGIDSLELAAARPEVERASIDVSATNILQRLLPRVTLSASFGIGEVIFRDPSTDAITVLPRDSYRLTFSLGIDQLFRSPDYDRALVRLKGAEFDLARTRMLVSQRQLTREMDENAVRTELTLLAEEQGLVRRLVAYNEMLFDEGKTEFEVIVRAKLQLLNLSRAIAQVSQRLVKSN